MFTRGRGNLPSTPLLDGFGGLGCLGVFCVFVSVFEFFITILFEGKEESYMSFSSKI